MAKVRIPGSTLSADPEKAKEWRKRSKGLKRGDSQLDRTTPIPKCNRERRKRLYQAQFGQKGRDMAGLPCWVTTDDGTGFWPVDNAHVGSPDPDERKRTRGAGAGPRYLARLRRDVHRSFDTDTDEVFLRRWQTTKQWVREQAVWFDDWYWARAAK